MGGKRPRIVPRSLDSFGHRSCLLLSFKLMIQMWFAFDKLIGAIF